MDSAFINIETGVVALYVIYELHSVKNAELSPKTKKLSYISSVLLGISLAALLYTGTDILYFIFISILFVPFWLYHAYIRFQEDKKNVLISLAITASKILVVWLYGF